MKDTEEFPCKVMEDILAVISTHYSLESDPKPSTIAYMFEVIGPMTGYLFFLHYKLLKRGLIESVSTRERLAYYVKALTTCVEDMLSEEENNTRTKEAEEEGCNDR